MNSICTIGINTNQSQCWIFNSQSTVSYHLYLCFREVISMGSFYPLCHIFFSPPV